MFDSLGTLFPTFSMALVMVVATILGATMRAFSGFGSGLLLAPVFSLYLEPTEVVAIVVLLNYLSTFQMLPEVWKHIDWPLIRRMVPAVLAGVPFGWLVLNWLDPMLVRRLVAGIVVVLSLVLLSGWVYQGARGKVQDAIAGVTSGVLTAIAGIGGLPFVLYMLSAKGYSPVAFRTFFTVVFLSSQTLALILIFVSGDFGMRQAAYIGVLLPIYLLATGLGSYLFARALKRQANQIKRISLILLLVVGVITLVV